MFRVTQILQKIMGCEKWDFENKLTFLRTRYISNEVLAYLKQILEPLTIQILAQFEGDVFSLSGQGLLEGWCWQTTLCCIVFFADKDYIVRGTLNMAEEEYSHSWICFSYQDEAYVFDPCLQLLVRKKWYDHLFIPQEIARIYANQTREFLIQSILNPEPFIKDKLALQEKYERMKFFWVDFLKELDSETFIRGDVDDESAFMYRNSTGYQAMIEDGQIKKLVAHYYEPF